MESPTLEDVRARGIGRLSIPDWSCIALAEERANARIVTDDRTLRRVAREREIGVMWGAALAIEMFETCAISTKEYRAGLDAFIDDLFLNPAVVDALESASKSG